MSSLKTSEASNTLSKCKSLKSLALKKELNSYAAKTYCAHFRQGGKYHDLKKVVFLAITNYTVFPDKKDRYKSDHVVLDKESHEHDLKDFSFTFVELPKFTKRLDELKTIEDRWYYFLKHGDESEDIEAIIAHHPEIREAYEVLDRYHWSENDLQWYEKMIMNEADAHGTVQAAKDEGFSEGEVRGQKAKALEIAKNLLDKGLSIREIAEITGLDISDIGKA